MALGDGIRRNIATVSKQERDLFIAAIKQLNQTFYQGARTDFPAGHVSYWFKQDEIHQSSHVHGCPQFLPWHREICNRFEGLLRQMNPLLSLHYWDWNQDPAHLPDGDGGFFSLFDSEFMGNADGTVDAGAVGDPLLAAGFYNPAATNYRDDVSPKLLVRPNPNDPTTFSYPANGNPADPPQTLTRQKVFGAPLVGQWLSDPFGGDWTPVAPNTPGAVYWATDDQIVNAPTWTALNDFLQGGELTGSPNAAHALAHQYIGGNLSDAHLSFRDPFVFMLHANLDRLWAMWQRKNGAIRLDPAQVYGSDENSQGSGDVEFGDPQWGILSPLEPWAGYNAQTNATGIVTSLWPIRPWFAPENQQAYEDPKGLSVVLPPSYDTALHSSYIILNQQALSSTQAAVSLTFSKALYIVYDGFRPDEVGTPTSSNPAVTFSIGGVANNTITVANPQVFLEDPSGAADVPQRVSIAYDIVFTNTSAFPTTAGATVSVVLQASLGYTVGGTGVTAHEQTAATLLLVNQPSPYMVDVDPTIPPPGPPNPYWLSADTRVFKITQNDGIAGVTQGADPLAFIRNLVNQFNLLPNDNNHPYRQLVADEEASQLELAPTFNGTPVYNYAIAKVRYRGNVPANNVSVFFRAFKTMVSALNYDATGGNVGNYRRNGNTPGSAPLLGIESNEISSIPFFAATRVPDMANQHDDAINTQISFQGNGSEEVVYCGVWLDINDTNNLRFPINPLADPGGPNGPFQGQLFTIQQLVTGLHYCLVAEIFFWPTGTTSDPIPINSTPASSDRLAQRNLAFDSSGNPGGPSTHIVQHTFMVRPSPPIKIGGSDGPAGRADLLAASDELLIQWGNMPRATQATLFFPEVDADVLVSLAALRQHPNQPVKVDAHTIALKVAGATYVPLPPRATGNLAALLTLTLPDGIRVGQQFKMNVQQYTGVDAKRSARRMLGGFELDVPVHPDREILPRATRNLSLLRYIHQTIPASSRWHPIFTRWIAGLVAKVAGLGGDPTHVLPSPTGGDRPKSPHHHHHHHHHDGDHDRDDLRYLLSIPWDDCEVEGEIELKLRFRKRRE
jgi:hypothetical protein